jgi:hypothetical protein
MTDKFLFVILLLLLVIIVAEAFAVVLSIPILHLFTFQTPIIYDNSSLQKELLIYKGVREGLAGSTCLPNCSDVTYDYNTNTIPPCKELKSGLLTSADAKSFKDMSLNYYKTAINKYLNSKYNYNSLILPLKNEKINFPAVANIPSLKNNEQIVINSYFTEPSGVLFTTNQDVLDNIINNTNFSKTLPNFKYSLDSSKPSTSLKTTINNTINQYKTDSLNPPEEIKIIINEFIQDISGFTKQIDSRCDNYYTETNLLSLIDSEIKSPSYYGPNSSFHKLSNYIMEALSGKLILTP